MTLSELVEHADLLLRAYAQRVVEIENYPGDRASAMKGLWALWGDKVRMAVALKAMYSAIYQDKRIYSGQPLPAAVRALVDRELARLPSDD
jgi:hypothetical protein